MMYGMAQRGYAPKVMSRVSRNGVPWMTVVIMVAALLVGVLLNYTMPDRVFLVIASIATFATVFVWLMILFAQYRSRKQMSADEVAALKFPVPFWPYGQLIAIGFLVFVIAVLAFDADSRVALVVGAVWLVLLALAYRRWARPEPVVEDEILVDPV